ncbi:1-acyl-sn-glycerol-3-phosphate acyltransferase [Alloacidobacterium dinghuense]|uniref:1-acyl-sn-glycerol-3-phosphate acyltransferase n=1 Tax=Alloacidobacterium dinghuense TaxID=2763107 RepID=A0A7G8BIK9_9BACT|nr:lysophospholipid acyltransferase family protein [Alloacidobacterium dinghuense]QNI32379.1 1-acyl-sn-glycerol-3-phosphate acyltransferase [Alloacidobacterium dinghuense]
MTLADRAEWMQASCALVLRRLSIALTIEGPLPSSGLVVSNHLTYFDILLHAAAGPRIFVSKADVRLWPLFGWLARCGGTIFITRGSRSGATEAAISVEYALRSGVTVVLFPEGTSTDGTTLLPFHSFLFEPAVEAEALVTASALNYDAKGVEERDLCYYGDMQFVPNLVEVFEHEGIRSRIRYDSRPRVYSSRKHAANDTWERVARLRLRASLDPLSDSPWHTTMAGGAR